jgi:hypothetical protein
VLHLAVSIRWLLLFSLRSPSLPHFISTINRLKDVEVASELVEALPDSEFSRLASIFYSHNAQKRCALVLIHRHYALVESEIPVDHIIRASDGSLIVSIVQPQPADCGVIYPFRFTLNIEGNLTPYEFTTVESAASTGLSTLEKGFFAEVAAFLAKFGLLDIVGIVPYDCADYGFAVEHTDNQRRNISVPSDSRDGTISTCWIFPNPEPGNMINPSRITKYACMSSGCQLRPGAGHWKDSHLYT